MTTNSEYTRNLIQAGAFLKELAHDPALPDHIREEARRLVLNYPAVLSSALPHGEQTFRIEEPWFGPNLDHDWRRNSHFKPTATGQ